MAETGTVLIDGAWFLLAFVVAGLTSGVAAWVTPRIEARRRKDEQERAAADRLARAQEREDERQRWADERQDRAAERDDRERERRDEAARRWDRERHLAYASLLADVTEWRERVAALMQGQDVGYPWR